MPRTHMHMRAHADTHTIILIYVEFNERKHHLASCSLPSLPRQLHVRPGRNMWQAADITLTFSARCSSASLTQTSQCTVNHPGGAALRGGLRARKLHPEKQKFCNAPHKRCLDVNLPLTPGKILLVQIHAPFYPPIHSAIIVS